jgi:hypothetical protein
VFSLTTEAPPAMLNLDNKYSSADKAYIEPARSITADHSDKRRKELLKYGLGENRVNKLKIQSVKRERRRKTRNI